MNYLRRNKKSGKSGEFGLLNNLIERREVMLLTAPATNRSHSLQVVDQKVDVNLRPARDCDMLRVQENGERVCRD